MWGQGNVRKNLTEVDIYMLNFWILEKHDKTDKNAMWQVLKVSEVGGKLLRVLKSFHKESKANV